MSSSNLLPVSNLFSLANKTVIVTGGTGGLGLCMVGALAEAGANIVSVQLAGDPNGPALGAAIKDIGRELTIFECNVTDSENLRQTFARIWEAGITPDILLNCAGIIRRGKVEDMKDTDIDAVSGSHFPYCLIAYLR
jgi:2-deoxy-D-gluconate 3-dehydrogenase